MWPIPLTRLAINPKLRARNRILLGLPWSGVTDVMIWPFVSCDDSAVDRG